jgi:hypothetical protein
MKPQFCLILFLFFMSSTRSQNLVPNSGFETCFNPPCGYTIVSFQFNDAISDWFMPTYGSSDILSTVVSNTCYGSCFSVSADSYGQQAPRSGNIMVGIFTYGPGCNQNNDYREYIEVRLNSPLVVGANYRVEFYVSLAGRSYCGINNLGALLTVDPVIDSMNCYFMNLPAQISEVQVITDTTNWTLITGTFIAISPAEYLTIGNFHNDSTTNIQTLPGSLNTDAFYFIDDVSVFREVNNSTGTINPVDDISVYPSYFSNMLTIKSNKPVDYLFKLFDIRGALISANKISNSLEINTSNLSEGMYLYEITDQSEIIQKGKLIK